MYAHVYMYGYYVFFNNIWHLGQVSALTFGKFHFRENGFQTHAMTCGAGTGVALLIKVCFILTLLSVSIQFSFSFIHFLFYYLFVFCLPSVNCLFLEMICVSFYHRKPPSCFKDLHVRHLGILSTWMHMVKR